MKARIFDKYSRNWEHTDIFYDRNSTGIAVREHIFGEGKERAVREVNALGEFVGPLMVGKESLFVEDRSDSISFHKTFFIVQQLSQQMARRFNEKLLSLPGVNRESTPTINFLDCVVMILRDEESSSAKFLLVEKMLDHTRYKKWNNNDGFVDGMTPDEYSATKTERHIPPKQDAQGQKGHADCSFSIEDIPQAFSHFTYLASNPRFLI